MRRLPSIDKSVEQVLEALEKTGQLDNTIGDFAVNLFLTRFLTRYPESCA
jgi:hypothetical protein